MASISCDFQLSQYLNHSIVQYQRGTCLYELQNYRYKKLYPIIAFIFIVTGCAFQKPDYVKVITAPELNQVMQKEDIFLVDVHTPKQRHIKGTDLFIPYNEIEKHKDQLPKDKNTPIYLYCESGPMGNAAAKSLYELGYRNLTNLDGGAKAWNKAGLDFE